MYKKRKTNINDIAKLANVSTATVSRALNTPEKVLPETVEKILSIVNEYNYVPRTASAPHSNTIAFITDVQSVFYNMILQILIELAKKDNYAVITLATNSDPILEQKYYKACVDNKVSGIILTGFTKLKNVDSSIPTVVLDGSDRIEGKFCNICSDNFAGIEILINYLFKLNHRTIGFISGGSANAAGSIRENIFVNYMENMGHPVTAENMYSGDFLISSGISAFDYFYSLANMPTAIIAANDAMAQGFIIRANAVGVKIPEDVSICSFDSIVNNFFIPRITSVRQDLDAFATEALNVIKDFHNGIELPERKILPVTLAMGESCYKVQ